MRKGKKEYMGSFRDGRLLKTWSTKNTFLLGDLLNDSVESHSLSISLLKTLLWNMSILPNFLKNLL